MERLHHLFTQRADLGSEPSTACDHHQVILSLGNVRAGRIIANLPHAILHVREAEKVNDLSTVTPRTAHSSRTRSWFF